MLSRTQQSYCRNDIKPNLILDKGSLSMKKQSGAVLIVVLLFLILITLVGAIAVKQSGTDLRLATSDQVGILLLNTSDSAHAHLERASNTAGTRDNANIMSTKGAFGYFMGKAGANNRGDQIIFCYNPRTKGVFLLNNATVLSPNGGSKLVGGASANNYCDTTEGDDYTSARNVAMTQVMVTNPESTNTPQTPFEGVTKERDADINESIGQEPLFEVHSAAILPALSQASDSEITNCLKKPSIDPTRYKDEDNADFDETVTQCLEKEGTPNKAVVELARMRNINESDLCIGYGKGDGEISGACQEKFGLNASGELNI